MFDRESDVQQNTEISVNWLRINVPSVLTMISGCIVIVVYVQDMKARIDAIEASRAERSAAINREIADIQNQIQQLNNLPLRMDIAEKSIAATNARFDTFINTFGLKVDGMSDKVNALTTKVEVLSQKIDQITPEKKAELLR